MAAPQHWIVTASPGRPIAEIAADLTRAGFAVDRVLETVGCISGTATAGAVSRIRAIPGVASVSVDRAVQAGPVDG